MVAVSSRQTGQTERTKQIKQQADGSLAELGWPLPLWLCLAPTLVLLAHVCWEEAGDQVLVHGPHVLLLQPTPEVTANRTPHFMKYMMCLSEYGKCDCEED